MATKKSDAMPLGYDEMYILSAHMLAAVERDDWDRVQELETQIVALRDHLQAHPVPVDASPEALTEQRKKISAIILNQQCVLDQARPRMEEIRRQLDSTRTQRRVNEVYSAGEEI